MQSVKNALSLRIFINEQDAWRHRPLYRVIVESAHDAQLAGATAWQGLLSFGSGAHLHSARLLDFAADLPIIIEIIDEEDEINQFIPVLDRLFDESGCGGTIICEEIAMRHFPHKKH